MTHSRQCSLMKSHKHNSLLSLALLHADAYIQSQLPRVVNRTDIAPSLGRG